MTAYGEAERRVVKIKTELYARAQGVQAINYEDEHQNSNQFVLSEFQETRMCGMDSSSQIEIELASFPPSLPAVGLETSV
ncbi:hypothetical protein J6590_000135 [Homalodisca vitripennis]|nr:hypothetical protein J6590_000135 [Homalodisca vitripennis]